jgi:hypothetical protein
MWNADRVIRRLISKLPVDLGKASKETPTRFPLRPQASLDVMALGALRDEENVEICFSKGELCVLHTESEEAVALKRASLRQRIVKQQRAMTVVAVQGASERRQDVINAITRSMFINLNTSDDCRISVLVSGGMEIAVELHDGALLSDLHDVARDAGAYGPSAVYIEKQGKRVVVYVSSIDVA